MQCVMSSNENRLQPGRESAQLNWTSRHRMKSDRLDELEPEITSDDRRGGT